MSTLEVSAQGEGVRAPASSLYFRAVPFFLNGNLGAVSLVLAKRSQPDYL